MADRQLGNVFVRFGGPAPRLLMKGERIPMHDHKFDHVLQVLLGKALVRQHAGEDGPEVRRTTRTQPRVEDFDSYYCHVEKGVWHSVEALEDFTYVNCWFAHHTPQGEVVLQYTGWSDSYN